MRIFSGILLILVIATGVGAEATTQPVAERTPHALPRDGEIRQLTIKELGNFAYDETNGGNIPEDVKRLSGRPIRVMGYMMPLDQADQITAFALVPSLFECCFGQPPQIQHTITVHCPPGKALQYYPEEIVCEGTLKVQEKRDGDWIISIFELDVTSVKPAAK
jgi:hypothetical protein